MSKIAITGLGAVTPVGNNKEQYWRSLKEGMSGLGPVTRFDPSDYKTRIAGEVPLPLPFPKSEEEIFNNNNHRSFTSKMIISAAVSALHDAGFNREDFRSSHSGVWVGTSTTDIGVVETEYDFFKSSGRANPYVITSCYPHAAASEIGTELGCLGPVISVSIGCTSGLYSVISAAEAIQNGEVNIALAGGGDAPLTPFLYACFCDSGLLNSSFNDRPQLASRPFDAGRKGGVLSEGAGMVVLEKEERALEQNKKIYGYLTGWAISNSYTFEVMEEAFIKSMSEALKAARVDFAEVDYICANAPGDKYIDAAEIKAIEKVFSRHAYNIPISSINSSIGNPLAASGPLKVIASLKAMEDKFLPPTINLENPKPDCGFDFVPQEGRVARLKNTLVNVQGLGGSNISVVLKYPDCSVKQNSQW